MAIYGVGNNRFDVRLGKRNGKIYQLAVVGDISVSRSINTASTMKLTVLRDTITPEKGEFIAFRLDGVHDIFYGTVEETAKSKDMVELTCYDQLFFLANNTYTQNYGTLKASELLDRMITDFGFTTLGNITDTEYPIPNVILQNANLLDTMVDALNITFRNTGRKFYIYDYFNNICLDYDDNNDTLKVNTMVISPQTCMDYTYKENLSGFYNVVRISTNEENLTDRKTVEIKDEESIRLYGERVFSDSVKDGEDPENVAKTLFEDKHYLKYKLSVSDQIGDPRVVGGSSVYVDFYSPNYGVREYIRGWFRVDSVTHNFSNATHLMNLDLTLIQMNDNWEYG